MFAIWNKNGYVTIPVEQSHIDASMERNSSHCMTAMAIQSAIPDARHISVDLQTIRWTRKGLRYCFLTPHVCQDNIIEGRARCDQTVRAQDAARVHCQGGQEAT